MEILLAAKKWALRTLSSPTSCWAPVPRAPQRGAPSTFLTSGKEGGDAAEWALARERPRLISLMEVKAQNPTVPPLMTLDSHIPRGKLESLCLGTGFWRSQTTRCQFCGDLKNGHFYHLGINTKNKAKR